MLVPLRNFAVVDADKRLYRSAQPLYSYEYKFMKDRLGVGIIVNLRSELNHDKKFADQYGIQSVTIGVPDHKEPTIEQANEFMKLIKNNSGVLFHCEHGHGRTSTFCVLARLAMGWTLEDSLKEESDIYGYTFRHQQQLDFLHKNFDHAHSL